MTELAYCTLKTELGELLLGADNQALRCVFFPGDASRPKRESAAEARNHPILARAKQQLREYFASKRRTFDVPLAPHGTEFQQHVWKRLRQIPYGKTASYGDIARHIGRPTAMRAVGAANGQNPIPIIIPCHRVIGSSGALVGFGGGLELKEWLLRHEGIETIRRGRTLAAIAGASA